MKLCWFNNNCGVPGCSNFSTEGEKYPKDYFDLPAEPQARSRWLKAILTEDSNTLKVCEDHFKEDDMFRDKNNRKKLRLNSVPSVKLPTNICPTCLGLKEHLQGMDLLNNNKTVCHCFDALREAVQPTTLQPIGQVSPGSNKRTRITWTVEEKKVLFKAIKKYGDVKLINNNVRINWSNVANYCRSNGCFGNEKELKTVWQYLRNNAAKIYRNEIYGSKLERKISRFLYGKSSKRSRVRTVPGSGSSSNDASYQASTDEEEEYRQRTEMIENLVQSDCNIKDNFELDEQGNQINQNQVDEEEEVPESEEEQDEYYSISDVEEIFKINIRPRPPKEPKEIISLLSSDDELS